MPARDERVGMLSGGLHRCVRPTGVGRRGEGKPRRPEPFGRIASAAYPPLAAVMRGAEGGGGGRCQGDLGSLGEKLERGRGEKLETLRLTRGVITR